MKEVAEGVLPVVPQNKNGTLKYLEDRVLTDLSREQRRLSRRIYHPGKRDAAKVRLLRQWRSNIYAEMRQRIVYLEEKRAEELAKRLMESRGNRQLFETQRLMSRKKRLQLRLQDAEGSDYTEHRRMLEPQGILYDFFQSRWGHTAHPVERRGAAAAKENHSSGGRNSSKKAGKRASYGA